LVFRFGGNECTYTSKKVSRHLFLDGLLGIPSFDYGYAALFSFITITATPLCDLLLGVVAQNTALLHFSATQIARETAGASKGCSNHGR
jgi:hypothetical protein